MTVIQSSNPLALSSSADPAYINSQSIDWNKFYQGITPTQAQPTYPTVSPYGPSASMPTFQPGMLGRGLPPSMGQDRLPQGTAGLPNPSPGSGLMPQELAKMGGWTVDPLTGVPAYVQPNQNSAVTAANGLAQGVPMPRPRPPWAPTSIDMAAIMAQQGANPGMGGAMFGNGVMAPGIAPQGPPPAGIAPTHWRGEGGQSPSPLNYTLARAAASNGYVYGRGANGQWHQQGRTPWASLLSPSQQYDVANQASQIAAKIRQANATGQTGVYRYVNGNRVGTVNGMSGANAYDAANQAARQRASSSIGGSSSSGSSSGNLGGVSSSGRRYDYDNNTWV